MNYVNPHAPSCPWFDITQATGAPNVKWCEETLCQWVSEPANTWSNLGYLFIGILITVLTYKRHQSKNLRTFGPIIFFMGAMSFFFHQSNFYLSQVMDHIGMFLFVGWTIGMNLIRLGKLKPHLLMLFNFCLMILLTAVLHVMYTMGMKFQVLILLSGFVIIGTEIRLKKIQQAKLHWFISSVIFLIVAFTFQILDGKRVWCDPVQHGWFSQGHAVWHWIASVAMLFIYLHFSQTALEEKKN